MSTKWGQNFLVDVKLAQSTVDALEIGKDDGVLEIGPGRGILTGAVLPRAGRTLAVEIDPQLYRQLEKRFAPSSRWQIWNRDILEVRENEVVEFLGPRFKVLGNLPYGITSPILQQLLRWKTQRIVVMVQKEVGDRLLAGPGSKAYGILTLSVLIKAQIKKVALAPRGLFRPMPKVNSMVVALTPLEAPLIGPELEESFFAVVKAAFAHRRKTLINSLRLAFADSPKNFWEEALQHCQIASSTRAEALDWRAFASLAVYFSRHFPRAS